MKYPDNERILIVRPCLKAICLGVRSASKLLSVMLYRARNCREDETTFTFTCTQFDLVHDLCEELTTKQLHDMAIPILQLLGYLDVNGSGFRHTYTVHLDKVQEALSCYKDTKKLELLLISFIHEKLEEVPIELELVPIQLEEVLKQLELLLKTIRTSSHSKRGRKPKPQAASEGNSENADSNRDITDSITDNKREGGAFAPADFLPSEEIESSEEDEPTAYRLPAVKLNGRKPSQQTLPPMEPAAPEFPPAAVSGGSAQEAAAGEPDPAIIDLLLHPEKLRNVTQERTQETAAQRKKRLKQRQEDILALHCQLLGRNVVRSKDELEGARLMAESGATDAEIEHTYNRYKKDTFWGHQLTLKNIAKLLDTTVTQGNGASVPTTAKPKARPRPEDKNVTIFEYDSYWQVWKRTGDDQEWIWWQGEFCTPEEADERGYGGGFGLYEGHRPQQYGGVN